MTRKDYAWLFACNWRTNELCGLGFVPLWFPFRFAMLRMLKPVMFVYFYITVGR